MATSQPTEDTKETPNIPQCICNLIRTLITHMKTYNGTIDPEMLTVMFDLQNVLKQQLVTSKLKNHATKLNKEMRSRAGNDCIKCYRAKNSCCCEDAEAGNICNCATKFPALIRELRAHYKTDPILGQYVPDPCEDLPKNPILKNMDGEDCDKDEYERF